MVYESILLKMERHFGKRRHFRGNCGSRRPHRNRINPKRQRRFQRSPAVPAVPSVMLRARVPLTFRPLTERLLAASTGERQAIWIEFLARCGGRAVADRGAAPESKPELVQLPTEPTEKPAALTITVREALRPRLEMHTRDGEHQVGNCAEWLKETLAGGRVSAAKLRHACQEAGFTWSTRNRVRSRIGAGTRREGFGSGSKSF